MRRAGSMLVAGLALIASALLAAPGAATATEEQITPDPQIASMLDAVPGGVVISRDRAVWPELGMEMAVAPTSPVGTARSLSSARSAASVGSCPTGRVCAFNAAATAGARLSWSTCDTSFPVGNFVVRSIADARSTGRVQARATTGPLATAYAGGWKNVYGTTYRISCYT